MCEFPVTLRRVTGNSKGVWVSEAKIFKGKYEEGLGGGGSNQKTPLSEGYGYFLEQHNG